MNMTVMGMAMPMKVWASTDVPFDTAKYRRPVRQPDEGPDAAGRRLGQGVPKIKGFQVATEMNAEIMGAKIHTTSEVLEIAEKGAPAGHLFRSRRLHQERQAVAWTRSRSADRPRLSRIRYSELGRPRPLLRAGDFLFVLGPVLDGQVGGLLLGQGLDEEVGDLEVGQEGDGEVDGHPPQLVVAVERGLPLRVGDGDDEIDLPLAR